MDLLRPWIELVQSTVRYGLRIGISNFRFELGVLIGGFEHCDRETDEEIVAQHRCELVRQAAERQAITS